MNVGTITAHLKVRTQGLWRLTLVAILGKIAARRGVDVRVSIETQTR